MFVRLKYMTILTAILAFSSIPAIAEVWTENDWSHGNWSAIELLDGNTSAGELVLQADTSHFLLAFDATDYPGVWDMAVWQGRLYLAAGVNPPMMSDGGDILVYDYENNICHLDYSVFEQGIVVLKEHDGIIYSPGIDSRGTHDWGNLYYNNGSGWVRKETLPYALHVHDIFFHNDKIWVTTGLGWPNYRAGLLSSDDMGETWVEEFALYTNYPQNDYRRIYGATTFGTSIFMQPDFKEPEGRVIIELKSDGSVVEHEITTHTDELGGFQEFQGKLYCRLRYALYAFDGMSFSLLDLPVGTPSFASRGMTVFQDRLYIGGRHQIYSTADGENWDNLLVDQYTDHVFETLEAFHGRLYAGSNPFGEVYVTGVPASGILISQPHCFQEPAGSGVVKWQALMQGPETVIKFQIRSAIDETGLPMASFIGPDGTATSWYETPETPLASNHSGDSCFQYQVMLESGDQRFAPVLQEFQLEIHGMISATNDIPASGGQVVAHPNPFNPQTTIFWEQLTSGPVTIDVFDISGRRIASLLQSQKSAGRHSIAWNGCNDHGERQSAGVYLVSVKQAGSDAFLKLILVP